MLVQSNRRAQGVAIAYALTLVAIIFRVGWLYTVEGDCARLPVFRYASVLALLTTVTALHYFFERLRARIVFCVTIIFYFVITRLAFYPPPFQYMAVVSVVLGGVALIIPWLLIKPAISSKFTIACYLLTLVGAWVLVVIVEPLSIGQQATVRHISLGNSLSQPTILLDTYCASAAIVTKNSFGASMKVVAASGESVYSELELYGDPIAFQIADSGIVVFSVDDVGRDSAILIRSVFGQRDGSHVLQSRQETRLSTLLLAGATSANISPSGKYFALNNGAVLVCGAMENMELPEATEGKVLGWGRCDDTILYGQRACIIVCDKDGDGPPHRLEIPPIDNLDECLLRWPVLLYRSDSKAKALTLKDIDAGASVTSSCNVSGGEVLGYHSGRFILFDGGKVELGSGDCASRFLITPVLTRVHDAAFVGNSSTLLWLQHCRGEWRLNMSTIR